MYGANYRNMSLLTFLFEILKIRFLTLNASTLIWKNNFGAGSIVDDKTDVSVKKDPMVMAYGDTATTMTTRDNINTVTPSTRNDRYYKNYGRGDRHQPNLPIYYGYYIYSFIYLYHTNRFIIIKISVVNIY